MTSNDHMKKDYLLLSYAINGDEESNLDSSEGIHASVTHRRHSKKLSHKEKEAMQHMESLDFSETDNILLRRYHSSVKKRTKIAKTFGKWVICTLIGIFVGGIVYGLKQSVDRLQDLKYGIVEKYMYSKPIAFMLFLSFNLLYGLLSSVIVLLFGPLTSSSGLPEVKGYLNGVRVQKAFNLKTVIGKITSLILSFSSSLVLGPEGPMVMIGAGIGSSISQFRSKTLGIHIKQAWRYQNDNDKRDFISCGAAAGIAAAFGAPIGGVLFALEEGSSFWSRQLTWRTFFSCLIATMVANLFLQFGLSVHDYGLLSFYAIQNGASKAYLYSYWELIPFACMGIIGGLLGALFVHVNVRINYIRKSYFTPRPKYYRLIEVAVVVLITSIVCFFPPLAMTCRSNENIISNSSTDVCDITDTPITKQFFCPDGTYNPLASLSFTSSESALKLLYNRDRYIFTVPSLVLFSIFYLVLCTITSGLYVSSGIFIPMMLIGASWGRLVGLMVGQFLKVDPSVYALIGSAAMMGGSLRLTISLVVIIVELTETTQYLLPVILVVMTSKWTGDFFNESVYEHLMELKCIPYLPSAPSKQMAKLSVADAMSTNVKVLPEIVKVSTVVELLTSTKHNGFPVVMIPSLHGSENIDDLMDKNNNNNNNNNNNTYSGSSSNRDSDIFSNKQKESKTLCGLILRNQLLVLLKNRIFVDANANHSAIDFLQYEGAEKLPIDYKGFTTELARKIPSISIIAKDLLPQELEMCIDLRPYMDFAVVSIKNYSSLSEAYRLFRLAGLRHIVIVNVFNQIVGMITRKDLL